MKIKKIEGGLRLKGKLKKKPLITIVTVVRNGEKTLERTIKSVINQTARKEIEYIIIDGNSTDKTLDIIKKYNNKVDYWMSEPDKGIYDAMNKGVLLAKGEYIQFLNSDDYFISISSLKSIIKYLNKDIDIFSCKVLMKRGDQIKFNLPNKKINLINLRLGNTLAHPATFMKKRIFEEVGFFNIKYKISADYDLIIKCFLRKYNIYQRDNVIINFNLGGVSSNNIKRIKESTKVIKENFNKGDAFKYFITEFPPALIERIFIFLGIIKLYRKLKYKIISLK